MSDEPTPDGSAPASGADVRPAIERRRVRLVAAVAAVCAVAVAAVAAAVVVGASGGEASAGGGTGAGDGADHAHAAASPAEDDAGGHGSDVGPAGPHRGHDPLPPYEQRYADATDGERQAADELVEDVRSALVEYADVDAAVAAGYQPPRRPRGQTVHYLDVSGAGDGSVGDPSRPNGLVYRTGGTGEPVLLGAFFVAPPGTPAPSPAGDLVVWHSHDPSCPAFFTSADAPCTDTRRMLHVWTVEQVELVGRRGQPVEVDVVDPFGAPFRASVAPVG